MKIHKNLTSWLILCSGMFSTSGFSQVNKLVEKVAGKQDSAFQKSVENQAQGDKATLRQFIADSLQLVYDEIYQEKLDSVEAVYPNQTNDLLNQLNTANERNQLPADSVSNLYSVLSSKSKSSTFLDPNYESKYFIFEKMLKQEVAKSKQKFLKIPTTIENIMPYQIQEMQNYIDLFYPSAKCDSVQDFITQIYTRAGDWSNAEYSLLKFLYLYPESPLYDEVKSIRSAIFQTEKFYKSSSEHLMRFIGDIPKFATPVERYFEFVESIRYFIDIPIRDHFLSEASAFLKLYPYSSYSPMVSMWIAEYYLNHDQPKCAYLTYQKTILFYPNDMVVPQALFQIAVIQQKNFEEYENTIKTFRAFIQKFPQDTLAWDAQYRIAKILDENLSEWEQVVKEYQIFADKYPDSKFAIPCLMRKAVILSTKMSMIEEAVKIYQSVDERYPDTTAAEEALISAGNLYNIHKKYGPAIEQYMKMFQKYPQSEKAVTALEEIVKIYNEKLRDTDKTVETLNLIIANFPGTKAEARASKLLKKLEKAK